MIKNINDSHLLLITKYVFTLECYTYLFWLLFLLIICKIIIQEHIKGFNRNNNYEIICLLLY